MVDVLYMSLSISVFVQRILAEDCIEFVHSTSDHFTPFTIVLRDCVIVHKIERVDVPFQVGYEKPTCDLDHIVAIR